MTASPTIDSPETAAPAGEQKAPPVTFAGVRSLLPLLHDQRLVLWVAAGLSLFSAAAALLQPALIGASSDRSSGAAPSEVWSYS